MHNVGDVALTDVAITDTVPADTTFVSADSGGMYLGGQSVPGGSDRPPNQVLWAGKTLSASHTLSVSFVVRVANPLPVGTLIRNDDYGVTCAQGESASGEPVTTVVEPVPLLNIVKEDTPDPVTAGGLLAYTIVVSNTGYADATGVTITDTVPASTIFFSADSGGALVGDEVRWTGKTVPTGGALTVGFVVQVEGPADGPPIVNWTYGVKCAEVPEPVPGPPVTTWRSEPSQPSQPPPPAGLTRQPPGQPKRPVPPSGPTQPAEGTDD